MATHPIIIRAVDVPGHSEVSDLHHQALPDQAVAGRQVTVDKVQGGQVDHARGDLGGDVQHLRQRELTQQGHLGLLQDASVGAVSPAGHARETQAHSLSRLLIYCHGVYFRGVPAIFKTAFSRIKR